MPLFPLSRVTLGFIDAQESAELLLCRRRCGDRAAPSPCRFWARGAFWSIYPRADIKRLCKAQFCGTLALSSIVICCFNHCLQTTPNNVLRVYCLSGGTSSSSPWNISLLTLMRGFSSSPCLQRVSRIWLYEIPVPHTEQIKIGVDVPSRRHAVQRRSPIDVSRPRRPKGRSSYSGWRLDLFRS